MTGRLLVAAALIVATGAAVRADDVLQVSGTWQPVSQVSDTAPRWRAGDAGPRLEVVENATAECSVARDEPLPDDGWTLELWMVNYGANPNIDLTVAIGDPGDDDERGRTSGYMSLEVCPEGGRTIASLSVQSPTEGNKWSFRHTDRRQVYLQRSAGPIQQVLIAHNVETGSVRVAINGAPISLEARPVKLSPATVMLSATGRGRRGGSGLEIAGFSVGPWRDLEPEPARGLAFEGRQSEPRGEELAAAARVPELLDWLLGDPNFPVEGRAHALAARSVYERATTGAISEDTWAGIAQLGAASAESPQAASLILPIAVACADESQRAEADAWVLSLMDTLCDTRTRLNGRDKVLRRTSLLDPITTVQAAAQASMTSQVAAQLVAPVIDTAPGVALALYCSQMAGGGSGFAGSMARLLPDIAAVCPEYTVLAVRWLREWGASEAFNRRHQQNTLSIAAYRLAGLMPQEAVAIWGLIDEPDVKAETLAAMADVLPPGTVPDLDRQVEEQLRLAIEQKRETARKRTAVREIVDLAEFYADAGRGDDAVAAVREGMAEIDEEAESLCYDLRILATMMRRLEMPEADAYWDRALATAIEIDGRFRGTEEGGSTVYISATSFMVSDMVKRGEIDRAVEVAETLNTGYLPSNYGNSLSRIIYKVAETDLPRALELLDRVPEGCRARSSLIVRFIPRIAADDPDRAMALMAELSERVHKRWRYEILVAGGGEPSPEALQLRAELVAAEIEKLQPRGRWDSRGTLLKRLQGAPLAEVLALEPQLSADREFLAQQLLASCVLSAGLSEDELWQRYDQSHYSLGGMSVTGMVSLKDILRQIEQMESDE